jgi:type 1 glutamine amidotransferase
MQERHPMRTHATVPAMVVTACLAAAALGPQPASAAEGADRKLKVLVITGGHGYDQKTFGDAFKACTDMDITTHVPKKKESSSIVFDDISDWTYDAFVLYNFRQPIDEKQRANFLALLKRGVGLVSMHHAIAAYPAWREYEQIIGATYVLKEEVRNGVKFLRPKWKEGVDMNIHIEDRTHPITKDIADFTIHDETYKLWVYHEGNTLLLTTDHERSNRQIAWTRLYRGARIFYIQLGHGTHGYRKPEFQTILARGIRWASGGKPARR